MISCFSAEKLIALRKLKGLSQEKLAEYAGINIRSLQRIEKQVVKPQPHTMGLLARALDVSIDSLCTEADAETAYFTKLHPLYLLHYSVLAGLIFPFGNIIVPYIIWINKREHTQTTRGHLYAILNFQISWLIYLLIFFVFYFTMEAMAFTVFLILPFILFSMIICPVISGINVSRNKSFFYPFSISFFKENI